MRTLLGWTLVLLLVAVVCLAETIARRGPRKPRVRLLTKPKRTPLTVLVPPGPAPRLIPGESPKAKRARTAPIPVSRSILPGVPYSGIVDYIAPFAGSGEAQKTRVDYLLEIESDLDDDPGTMASPVEATPSSRDG